uniref:Uncharacterized protein n=1 Tax=Lepeophtheirus salmonis TaxID=72036 RepID=A0A0K2V873_LEPSM
MCQGLLFKACILNYNNKSVHFFFPFYSSPNTSFSTRTKVKTKLRNVNQVNHFITLIIEGYENREYFFICEGLKKNEQ